MTSKSFRDQYTIRQGRVTLYRRTTQGSEYQSDSWYAYFKIRGQKALRRSLKTVDKLEAESLAETMYYELTERAKRGLSLKSKKFNLVAASYLKDLSQNVDRESTLPAHHQKYKSSQLSRRTHTLNKYLVPYFQDKTIQEITDFDVESYKIWRNTYWITGEGAEIENIKYMRNNRSVARPKIRGEKQEPNYSTVNKELTILREIFEFARLNRKIDGSEVPNIKNIRKPKNSNDKKPGLTAGEVKHLLAILAARYYSQTNIKHKRHLKLLIHYIAFMCLTGLRVTESKGLKLSDCESFHKEGKDYLKIFVRGKGKSRELIGLNESATTLEKLKIYHCENAETHGWEFSDNINLFVDQYGKPVNNFSKGLNRAFEEAGLLYDKHGLKRNAGAFRKYYITTAILSGVDYMQLAKQCGTSANVIEKYYSGIETFHQPEKFIFINALTGVYDN